LEVGKASTADGRQQINGGWSIGGGFALTEDVYPYYPPRTMPGKDGRLLLAHL